MKVFKYLRSLLPIPTKWEGEDKQFALRLEDAFKWLQMDSSDRDDRIEEKGKRIYLSTDTTWATVWEKINVLSFGETALFEAYSTAYGVLSGGVRSNTMHGTITRRGNNFYMILRMNSDSFVVATVANASESSAGTYTERVITGELDNHQAKEIAANMTSSILTATITTQASAVTAFEVTLIGTATTRMYKALVYCAANGSITRQEIYKGSNITVTNTTNKLVIKRDGGAACIHINSFRPDYSVSLAVSA